MSDIDVALKVSIKIQKHKVTDYIFVIDISFACNTIPHRLWLQWVLKLMLYQMIDTKPTCL